MYYKIQKIYFRLALFAIFSLLFPTASIAQTGFTQTGKASYYASKFNGRKTSSGEKFNNKKFTAAHRELEFGTMLKVTNLSNNKSVVVKVNDRGPFAKNRILDLSKAAADQIDMVREGTATVKIEVIDGKSSKETDNQPVANKPDKKPKNVETTNSDSKSSAFKTGKTYSIWATEKFPKGYGIQLFTFNELDNAKEKCKELISKKLEEVYIQVGWEHKEKIYRVVYGTFASKHEAKYYKSFLKEKGYKGFVRKHFE